VPLNPLRKQVTKGGRDLFSHMYGKRSIGSPRKGKVRVKGGELLTQRGGYGESRQIGLLSRENARRIVVRRTTVSSLGERDDQWEGRGRGGSIARHEKEKRLTSRKGT